MFRKTTVDEMSEMSRQFKATGKASSCRWTWVYQAPRQKLARQASLPGRSRSLRSGSKHTPNPVPPLTTAAALTPQKSLQELPWIGGRCNNSARPPQARAARLTDGPGAGRRLQTTWWTLDAARLHLSYVVMQRSHGNPLVSFYSLLFMKALLALSLLMIPSILANI
jgi:hypothetical protein